MEHEPFKKSSAAATRGYRLRKFRREDALVEADRMLRDDEDL